MIELLQDLPPQHDAYCLKYDTNPAHGFLQELEELLKKHGTISGSVKKQARTHNAAAAPLDMVEVQSRSFPDPKPNQHLRLSLNEAIAQYRKGLGFVVCCLLNAPSGLAALGVLTSLTTRPEITFMNISVRGSDRYPSAAAWLALAVAAQHPHGRLLIDHPTGLKVEASEKEVQK